jgi:REP element-mobilizing transposase RayT
MATPRSNQVDLSVTPYYHCMSRCVRQSYICGIDKLTGKDYSHRKEWIINRLKLLTNVFCINVCAYAVMNNHYHMVLNIDSDKSKTLSDDEILIRWQQIYPGDADKIRKLPSPGNQAAIEKVRRNLSCLSRFMAAMNEKIAVLSNKEDECKGRFWDGRFKSQALLDEGALLTAMAYVDLNPIRAGIANTPEESEFTSIYERIQHYIQSSVNNVDSTDNQPLGLMRLDIKQDDDASIDFNLKDYIELVDYTGRIIRDDKPGFIPESFAPILERIKVTQSGWFQMVKGLQKNFYYAVGSLENLKEFAPVYSNRNAKCVDFVDTCYKEIEI